jgi:uncharacterized membrane protein
MDGWLAVCMHTASIDPTVWRVPAAVAACVLLTLVLVSIDTPVWLAAAVGALAGIRVAAPLLRGAPVH